MVVGRAAKFSFLPNLFLKKQKALLISKALVIDNKGGKLNG